MTARVIDCETTGPDPTEAKVISIASIDLNRDGSFYNPLTTTCDPGIPIPPEASAVHHMIDDDVRGRPFFADVIPKFRGADVYIAHNAAYEQALLDDALGGVTWICTMKVAYRVWADAPKHSNQALRYWRGHINPLGVDRKSVTAHDAMSDVIVTGALFFDLSKTVSFADMVAWTKEPMLFTTFNFGKYKGKSYAEIATSDSDYMRWIIDKSEMSDDVKYSARHWLGSRK